MSVSPRHFFDRPHIWRAPTTGVHRCSAVLSIYMGDWMPRHLGRRSFERRLELEAAAVKAAGSMQLPSQLPSYEPTGVYAPTASPLYQPALPSVGATPAYASPRRTFGGSDFSARFAIPRLPPAASCAASPPLPSPRSTRRRTSSPIRRRRCACCTGAH